MIRFATSADLGWLKEHDQHIDVDQLTHRLESGEMYLAQSHEQLVGLLRVDWIWSRVPFIEHVLVVPECRRKGVGRALVNAFSTDAYHRAEPYIFSSVTDGEDEPMRWHVAMGFRECGHVVGIDGPGSLERFMRRDV
jgi:GNAT superfamily N-acetyltransferase